MHPSLQAQFIPGGFNSMDMFDVAFDIALSLIAYPKY
jgi:hypothetical protein